MTTTAPIRGVQDDSGERDGISLPSVLVVHNRYLERGGEDSVFEAETALLEAHGHRIERLEFDNRDLPSGSSAVDALRMGLETVWSKTGRTKLHAAIEAFRPDVVHFHNTFPQVSPAAYEVARDHGAAVVQTLHNFRLACANGLMFRDGKPCESCIGKTLALPALQHACYRGSRAQTGAVVAMQTFHRLRRTWKRDVDLYISPSAFLRHKLVETGLPRSRVAIKPNFVDPDPGRGKHDGGYALFVGRLTPTKGIDTLLDAYRRDASLPPLHIAGDGEMAQQVQSAADADSRIVYRGRLDRAGVLEEMGSAASLVFPSIWYENFPVTIVEAFARGLPVLASNIGAIPEIVSNANGGLFKPGSSSDLAEQLRALSSDLPALQVKGETARGDYLSKYSGPINYEQLAGLYTRARRSALTARR